MHFTKPAWVAHRDTSAKADSTKRLSIFSIHVHPDGSRIATGGLDAKIRIWSTKPILNPVAEKNNRPPKSLCTLAMHTGPVLTVRWAHSGRWLASGSDDEIIMIWDLDPNARGKVWGSDEVNVEGWKPMKRLPGHESDVTDLAWAPQDRYLASVGLDSKVMIWCGYTLERLQKLDQHQGFVKGVCWDPVGEFLATQSDDRSVKIWRTSDWSLEAEVRKPFEDSPGSTFFRRLSWSPDGAHITASNATNNKGFVFIAAVITRGTWTSDISLVGHENTIEVAAYNPHIFLRNPSTPVATSNICSVVALGADDCSISVWQTKSARPLIVAKEVFERQIMDLSWSWDGMTLYAASSDGTIAVFAFEPDELEGIAPHSVQEQYLSKFGFIPRPIPEGYSHEPTPSLNIANPPAESQSQARSQSVAFDAAGGTGGEVVNVLVAKRNTNKKKRVGLSTMASAPSSSKRSSFLPPPDKDIKLGGAAKPSSPLVRETFFPTPDEQPFADPLPIDTRRGKEEYLRPPVYKTLGGDQQVLARGHAAASSSAMGIELPIPSTLAQIASEIEGEMTFEGYNPEDGDPTPTTVNLIKGNETLWLDYLPSPVIAVQATTTFCATVTLDGVLNVYSTVSGRRMMPTLNLSSPCSVMDGAKNCLMVITKDGMLYSWKVTENTAVFPPVSIAPLVASPNDTITSVLVRPNGLPIINCSNGVVYTYDPALFTWVKVSERWWAEGSDVWQGNQGRQAESSSSGRGIISFVEDSLKAPPNAPNGDTSSKPEWWDTALTLGHLETRLHAARLLDSPGEYKQSMNLYAQRIAEEGFKDKAEELIRELCGPIYWRPGQESSSWSPTVVGLAKRELLKDVLVQFVKSRTPALQKLGQDWQGLLNRMNSEL